MSYVGECGRLCNQIIKNLAMSFIAKKHDLNIKYHDQYRMDALGIPLFSGKNSYGDTLPVNDRNYEDMYKLDTIQANIYSDTYLQTHPIATRIYSYFRTPEVQASMLAKNPFKDRFNKNNDVYIHIRLTDAEKHNPGIEYYLKALSMIEFDNIHISSDNVNHDIIYEILTKYPDSTYIEEYGPEETLQFASTCKYVILSHGTFSAMIGHLAFFSKVLFPTYDRNRPNWFGDVFYMEGWTDIETREGKPYIYS
jgi:hypothetical protein